MNLLEGFLLLVEIKLVQKDSTKSKTDGNTATIHSRSKHLRKLHLVQLIQEEAKIKSGSKSTPTETTKDRLEQIDALKFEEETAKFVDFTRVVQSAASLPSYLVFLLNKERVKTDGKLKLISVKIKWSTVEEKESENSFDSDFGPNSKNTASKQLSDEKQAILGKGDN